jgi:hypothetical protein
VQALKQEYIQKLFALGQERETFSDEDKALMNLPIYLALDELYNDTEKWQIYSDAMAHYALKDAEFNELLVSFNIIGQYAQFELLIDQEPEQAVRLGILDPSAIETGAADTPAPTEPNVVEEPPVGELGWDPGWYAYTDGNDVKGLALHEGALYAAGAGGVVAWDMATGEYVKHTTLDGLLHVSAWDVAYCEMPDPRVIVATKVGLSIFDPASGSWDNTPITPQDSNVTGSDIDLVYCDAANGRLLIGYYGLGILDLNSGEFTRYTDAEGLVWNGVRDVTVSGSDIWIASGYNGVSHISAGQVTAYNEANGMPDESVYAIQAAADGSVWMAAGLGLIKFSAGTWTLYDRDTVAEMPRDIYELEIAADGTVWVGSSYGFMCQFDPASETCLTTWQDERDRYVTDMLLDDAGNLVYSNNGGVFVFDDSAISELIIEEDVLVSNFVDSLATDAAGMLWVGTDSGMQVFDPADPSTPLQLFRYEYDEPGVPGGNWARKLLPQPDGSMWAVITNGEASRYDGQTWTVYEDYYSYETIAVDDQGRVWLGDDGEGIAILDGDAVSTLTTADGLPDDEVSALLAVSDMLWIGSDSGLTRYQEGAPELMFGEEQAEQLGLYSATVLDLLQDANGDLLLGVYGGVLRYDGTQVTPLVKFDDLGADWSYASFKEMDLGPEGQLWVGTTQGLLYSDDGQNWDWFDTSNGLQSKDVDALLVDQFGTIWVGGGDNFGGGGLSRYVP